MAMLLEFSMFPLGAGESVGAQVAECVDLIDRSGLPYRLNAMGTVLEGEWDEVMGVVKACLQRTAGSSDRVVCTIKIDWRRGAEGRLEGKVASVEHRLGRRLRT